MSTQNGIAQKIDAHQIPTSASNADMFSVAKSERNGVPYTINCIRFFEGGEIKKQSHDDEHFVYCKSGTIVVGVGAVENILTEGMFVNIPPNVEHSFVNPAEEATEILILKI